MGWVNVAARNATAARKAKLHPKIAFRGIATGWFKKTGAELHPKKVIHHAMPNPGGWIGKAVSLLHHIRHTQIMSTQPVHGNMIKLLKTFPALRAKNIERNNFNEIHNKNIAYHRMVLAHRIYPPVRQQEKALRFDSVLKKHQYRIGFPSQVIKKMQVKETKNVMAGVRRSNKNTQC